MQLTISPTCFLSSKEKKKSLRDFVVGIGNLLLAAFIAFVASFLQGIEFNEYLQGWGGVGATAQVLVQSLVLPTLNRYFNLYRVE